MTDLHGGHTSRLFPVPKGLTTTPNNDLEHDRAIAWVKLIAQAKLSPVTIRFTGDSDRWLWQITNARGELLALQGNEFQVITSMFSC